MKYLMILLVSVLIGCSGSPDKPTGTLTKTPKGANVYGTVTQSQKLRIDSQIDKVNTIASSRYGYDASTLPRHEDYTVYIVATDARCSDPYSYIIEGWCDSGNCYDGTEYDKNPERGAYTICAPGQYFPIQGFIQVTPRSIEETETVRYEVEHQLLRKVDVEKYNLTIMHSASKPHPILCDGTEPCAR